MEDKKKIREYAKSKGYLYMESKEQTVPDVQVIDPNYTISYNVSRGRNGLKIKDIVFSNTDVESK